MSTRLPVITPQFASNSRKTDCERRKNYFPWSSLKPIDIFNVCTLNANARLPYHMATFQTHANLLLQNHKAYSIPEKYQVSRQLMRAFSTLEKYQMSLNNKHKFNEQRFFSKLVFLEACPFKGPIIIYLILCPFSRRMTIKWLSVLKYCSFQSPAPFAVLSLSDPHFFSLTGSEKPSLSNTAIFKVYCSCTTFLPGSVSFKACQIHRPVTLTALSHLQACHI